jgi:hypothetical protein
MKRAASVHRCQTKVIVSSSFGEKKGVNQHAGLMMAYFNLERLVFSRLARIVRKAKIECRSTLQGKWMSSCTSGSRHTCKASFEEAN